MIDVRTRVLGPMALGVLFSGCWTDAAPDTQPDAAPRMGHAGHRARRAPPAVDATSNVSPGPRGDAQGPNILFIVWDTVRADHTSLYGYGKPTTPRVKAWADASGLRFSRAVSPGVWTLPSHASLFTGLPVRTHGVDADYTHLDASFTTFAEVLYGIGYDTFAFSANPYIMDSTNLLQGFGEIEYPWSPQWKAEVQAHIASKQIAADESTVLSPGWPKASDRSNKYLYKEAGPVAAEALFKWIDTRSDFGRPWFAFLNMMEAHIPRIPSLASRHKVMTDAQITRSYTLKETTEDFHLYMAGNLAYDDADLATIGGVYDAALIDLDDATGALLDTLHQRGLDKNTIVVLVSDHGESLGDHGLLLHKYAVYDALSRVPMVISWPGHLKPGVDPAPTSTIEAIPRALALGHVPVPQSFLDTLAARPGATHPSAVTEYNAVAEASLGKLEAQHEGVGLAKFQRTWRSLELDQWKLIAGSDASQALYDVVADEPEAHPLQNAVVTTHMQGALDAWLKAVPEADKSQRTGTYTGHQSSEQKQALEALGYLHND